MTSAAITTADLKGYEEINFEGIDEDLAAFQEDEMVHQALHRGVDLRKYGAELELELRKVRGDAFDRIFSSSSVLLLPRKDLSKAADLSFFIASLPVFAFAAKLLSGCRFFFLA